MAILRTIKRPLGRAVLRGPVLDRWVARRGRQLDQAYRDQIVRTLRAPATSGTVRPCASSNVLRQILLIADCMWEQNDLVPELERICAVQLLNLRPLLKSKPRDQTTAEVVSRAVENLPSTFRGSPDVILFYARPSLLSEEVFHILRRQWHCPLLGMNLDDKTQFFPYGILSDGDDNYQKWARNFDLNITNCLPAAEWYRQLGLPCLYSAQGVHLPSGLSMPENRAFKHDITFLGSKKPERVVIIEKLKRAGVPIKLFGSGWAGTEWVDNPNEVFRGSQINLGIGFASPSLTLTNLKGRDFECPGVGACYLTTYNWELPLHYELGKEILCYREIEELIEMYLYYRRRPEECLKIAQAAWRRCFAEHTWEQRFRNILRHVGFRT